MAKSGVIRQADFRYRNKSSRIRISICLHNRSCLHSSVVMRFRAWRSLSSMSKPNRNVDLLKQVELFLDLGV